MEENKELQNQNQEPEKNREQVENTQNADNAAQDNASQQPKKTDSEDVSDQNQSETQSADSENAEPEKTQKQEEEVTPKKPEETQDESSSEQASEEKEPDGEEGETVQKEEVSEPESPKAQEKAESGSEEKPDSDSDEKIELSQDEDIYDTDRHKVPDHDDDQEEEDDEQQEVNEDFFLSKSREELLEMLKEVVQVDNVNRVKNKIALIRSAFVQKTKEKKQEDYEKFVQKGAEDEEFVEQADDLENQFNEVFGVYRKKKAEFNREQEEQKKQNLEKKNEILEKLRNLINSEEPLKKTYDEFRSLQAEWREIGMVPRGEVNELWRNYHFLVEKFFDKVKINQELRDLGLRKNLQKKIELCEKAEELLLEENVNKSFKLLQKYHEKWREIGPVPQDKNEETWQRFKSATDKINERRREYYDQRNEQREENYKAKLALCEKAEALLTEERSTVKDWLNATDRINELFKLWRSIGRAPGKQNDEIWSRFKSTLDKFFSAKKAFFKDLKDQQKENYNKKIEIIEQAEALKDSEDWKGTKNELINLQKKWKSIGPVPKKHSNKIWKRFRAACDHFFNRRDEYFKNIHQHEEDNLKKKQEVLDKIKAFELSGDKRKDLDALKEFQREWSEIGFVPIKKKDTIQKEYKEALDKHFNALDVSTAEKNVMNYKQKLENIKEDPNANQKISKERSFLMNKISKMEEDLQLWENNVGFLSDSKKSNQLRDEFEKKIEKHKREISVLRTKLRYLEKTEDEQ
ncbi:MAG: DUF349 domain-containing protein [Bacteroidota bacterium]